jgi:hypothetical protein
MNAEHALLGGAIDYAGLFPPAQLGMAEAVTNYAGYRRGSDAWALGRFVVPVGRLAELEAEARQIWADARGETDWRLSALAGPDLEPDLATIAQFNERHGVGGGGAHIDSLEIRASSIDEIRRIAELTTNYETYVEIPLAGDTESLVAAIARYGHGLRAKMRTGGTVANAFPSAEDIGRFMSSCIDADVPFKATAGLHHPVRGSYRLTYDAGADQATMFGYVNVMLAAALLIGGDSRDEATRALMESRPGAIKLEEDAIVWERHRMTTENIAEMRRKSMRGFGSCSFREPLDELPQVRAQ